jgi:hypothetical protein
MTKRKTAGAKYFGKPLTDDPDDAPELLEAFFRDGELRHGARLLTVRTAIAARGAKRGSVAARGKGNQTKN